MGLGFSIDPSIIPQTAFSVPSFDPSAFSSFGAFNPGQTFSSFGAYPGAGGFSGLDFSGKNSWLKNLAGPIASGGSGLLKGLASALSGGGGKRSGSGGFSLPGKMSSVEFAEWLASLNPDPGRMRF